MGAVLLFLGRFHDNGAAHDFTVDQTVVLELAFLLEVRIAFVCWVRQSGQAYWTDPLSGAFRPARPMRDYSRIHDISRTHRI